jgi:hypothetical protein
VRCGRPSLGGGRCELEQGHEGKHSKRMWRYNYPDRTPIDAGVFEWTEEGQQKLLRGMRLD